MTDGRYNALMDDDESELTENEIAEGWHFCFDWDGLLVGPEMVCEWECCTCLVKRTSRHGTGDDAES